MEWFIIRGDKLVGPATSKQIITLIEKGKITGDSYLQLGRDGARVEASSVEEFAAAFEELSGAGGGLLDSDDLEEDKPKAKSKKLAVAIKTTGVNQPDYSKEEDFEDFVSKKKNLAIVSIVNALCCIGLLSPHFFAGNMSLGLMRAGLSLVTCNLTSFVSLVEAGMIFQMSDNQFYHKYKANPKLFCFMAD